MVIKLDPKLLREPVADTGVTHGWVVNILTASDDRFRKVVNGNFVTLVGI